MTLRWFMVRFLRYWWFFEGPAGDRMGIMGVVSKVLFVIDLMDIVRPPLLAWSAPGALLALLMVGYLSRSRSEVS